MLVPIEAELAELLARYREQVDDQGRRVVVRNGYLPEREGLTTNPIESTFATIRHRTDRTKGCVSRNTMPAMIYKLEMSAEKRWRRIQGFDHLAKVIKGVKFKDGVEVNSGTDDSRSAA